jgi:COMPASS component SWD3
MVLQDEANMKTAEQQNRRSQIKRLRKAVLEGDWESASQLTLSKNLPRQHHKRYLYALYKQEYLELIERQEYQKAFAYLNRRLKPMEAITTASNPNEFQNLCYLLTCKVSTVYIHEHTIY